MFYSPLRYPGGKGKLEPFMEILIKQTGHIGGTYIEPFAGGAGIALELLEKNIVKEIVINDLDKGIYSFWKAILTETDRFIEDIGNVPLNIDEWNRQKSILKNNIKYSYELGFATFYLNRTNRSGIIKGGLIGGVEQNGKWKMDARFNRNALIERISKIAKRKKNIHIYNKDVNSFVQNYLPRYEDNAFVYFDPPYFGKGKQLYLNFFSYEDHVRIERMINEQVNCDWVITYDDVQEIADIYQNHILRRFDLNYSAAVKRKASEIIIFRRLDMIPGVEQLQEKKICVNLR
ncbi:DNA adenine methylase [[Clostridium] polysaccharolyticum]|uniref:site-specific DNA-methyltransferase (adenine-specific) n=1 Tax=[Clostridium] polysaccharolyticum TaxID=29364 RepID=A0A1H9Y037_9FIRM|nr:DNA adenine methylase [[Clostridium] polysaccharolyticum]SES61988.1 DNA adenine methylase [[Clostridium] polysaccharolyticum]